MYESSFFPIADQLLADFQQESHLMDLMIRGCIELRWAIGEEEKDVARAMIYNAFETYLIERGLSVPEAEKFCERYLEVLIQSILAKL